MFLVAEVVAAPVILICHWLIVVLLQLSTTLAFSFENNSCETYVRVPIIAIWQQWEISLKNHKEEKAFNYISKFFQILNNDFKLLQLAILLLLKLFEYKHLDVMQISSAVDLMMWPLLIYH